MPREAFAVSDCSRLPAGAATEVPAPVAQWARLDCRHYGQALVQSSGWTWHYAASFTTEVTVTAVMGPAAEEAVGVRYFLQLSVSSREGEAAARLHARFLEELGSYAMHAGESVPRAVHSLDAINDLLDRITVHFLEQPDGQFWAVACTPECRPENVFHVQRLGG
jgi:hypothetical protein